MPAAETYPFGQSNAPTSAGLAAMRERISEDIDRLLFEEAATCFQAGASRAAYIMAWISVAESLRNKFYVMAERDHQAGAVVGKIVDREKDERSADAYLLDQARKLGLVTEAQYKKLAYIREMRNVYAHPTGNGPTEQEVLAAIEIAVEAVLSQPPLLRHGYVNDLLKALFEERHWLADDEMVVRDYAAGVTHRIHPDVAPYLLTRLIECYEGVFGDPELATLQRRGEWFVAGFILELEPDLSKQGWKIVDVVRQWPAIAARLLGVPEVYRFLPEQAKGMVFGHLIEPDNREGLSFPRFLGLQQAQALISAGLLSPDQRATARAEEEDAPYAALLDAGVPLERYVSRLLADLRSHSWDAQNPAAQALGNAGPRQVALLRSEMQEQLGRNVLQAAEGSSWGAQRLIERVRRAPDSWPEPFVSGLLFETLVDDEDRFRLKGGSLLEVLEVTLSHECSEEMVKELAERVRRSEPKSKLILLGWYDHEEGDYEKTIAIFEKAKGSFPRPDLVDRLITAVRDAKPVEE